MAKRNTNISTRDNNGKMIVGDNNTLIDQVNYNGSNSKEELEQIRDAIYELPRHRASLREPNEFLEAISVSIIIGLLLGLLWHYMSDWVPITPLPLALIVVFLSSFFRMTHFGVRHSLVLATLIGAAFTGWIVYGPRYTDIEYLMLNVPIIGIFTNAIVGLITGLISSIFIAIFNPFDVQDRHTYM